MQQDQLYYQRSGGGVTIGGGEPTSQPFFTYTLPRCCIKFVAWIHQTLHQRGMAVKSMPSPGSIQGWPLESILKRLETAFLWEHTVESIASLCNNGVYLRNVKRAVSTQQLIQVDM